MVVEEALQGQGEKVIVGVGLQPLEKLPSVARA